MNENADCKIIILFYAVDANNIHKHSEHCWPAVNILNGARRNYACAINLPGTSSKMAEEEPMETSAPLAETLGKKSTAAKSTHDLPW